MCMRESSPRSLVRESRYREFITSLFSREPVKDRDDRQCIVLVVKKTANGERSSNSRFPPEDALPAPVRSFHHDTVQFIQKGALSFRRLRKRRRLVHIVARLPVVGRLHYDDVFLIFPRHEFQVLPQIVEAP